MCPVCCVMDGSLTEYRNIHNIFFLSFTHTHISSPSLTLSQKVQIYGHFRPYLCTCSAFRDGWKSISYDFRFRINMCNKIIIVVWGGGELLPFVILLHTKGDLILYTNNLSKLFKYELHFFDYYKKTFLWVIYRKAFF